MGSLTSVRDDKTIMIARSLEETKQFAEIFAKDLKGGEVILLQGDLGSGKTTFVRFVADILGVTAKVKSPTFAVMNEYPASHKEVKRILHLDLYRFTDDSQVDALALEDELRPDTIVFIEWPDAVTSLPIGVTKTIQFKFIDESTREISYGR